MIISIREILFQEMSPKGDNNQTTLSCYIVRLPYDNFIVKEASNCSRFFYQRNCMNLFLHQLQKVSLLHLLLPSSLQSYSSSPECPLHIQQFWSVSKNIHVYYPICLSPLQKRNLRLQLSDIQQSRVQAFLTLLSSY